MCFRLFCRLGQHLEQTSAGSVTAIPVFHPGRTPPVSRSTSSFVVRLTIVMRTQCCYWATVGRSLLIGWKDLKLKHVGNNQSGPSDLAFNIFKKKKKNFFPVSKLPNMLCRCFFFSKTHLKEKKGGNEKSQRTFLHAFTTSDLFSLAARPAPVPPD